MKSILLRQWIFRGALAAGLPVAFVLLATGRAQTNPPPAAPATPPGVIRAAAPAPATPAPVPEAPTAPTTGTAMPEATPAPAPALPGLSRPAAPATAPATDVPAAPAAPANPDASITLNFMDAPLDDVLAYYASLTGRTLIRSPGLTGTVTLRSQTRLTREEALQAIESALAMNNVTLVPVDDKFLKVVPSANVHPENLAIGREPPPAAAGASSDLLVSQIVELKYSQLSEIIGVIQGLLHPYGRLQPLERTNSLLVTDTRSNVARLLEVIDYLDRPAATKAETRVYELQHAEAATVAQQINELIQDSQNQAKARTGASASITAPAAAAATPPGVIRAPAPATAARTSPNIALELAERGIVTGTVKIMPDERTNVILIISEPENFAFFDRIVAVLDRAVEPEIEVKVYPLEFADAEEIGTLLNDLIGATSGSSRRATATAADANRAGTAATGAATAADNRSQALRDYLANRADTRTGEAAAAVAGSVGKLSSDTRIIADKRSNALLLMGRKSDIAVLQEVTRQLDVMLAQVIIEAVIIEVSLNDKTSYGLDWLQRSLTAYENSHVGAAGGVAAGAPVMSWGGGFAGGSGAAFLDGSTVGRDVSLSSGALTYYLTLNNLNLDAILRMAASSSDARILSNPVILTTDNTEAKIIAGEERPIVNATTTTDGGNQTSSYEYRNIGIELTVKPRINPQRFVVMDVTQTADNVGDLVSIDGNEVPVITKRELKASISVANRSTIVLGGLVSDSKRLTRSKVPFLGDIPILGRLFRSDDKEDARSELLVLLTPYVLMTPAEARAETARLHNSTDAEKTDWANRSWSDGDLSRQVRSNDVRRIPLRIRRAGTRPPPPEAWPTPDVRTRAPEPITVTVPSVTPQGAQGSSSAPATPAAPEALPPPEPATAP